MPLSSGRYHASSVTQRTTDSQINPHAASDKRHLTHDAVKWSAAQHEHLKSRAPFAAHAMRLAALIIVWKTRGETRDKCRLNVFAVTSNRRRQKQRPKCKCRPETGRHKTVFVPGSVGSASNCSTGAPHKLLATPKLACATRFFIV